MEFCCISQQNWQAVPFKLWEKPTSPAKKRKRSGKSSLHVSVHAKTEDCTYEPEWRIFRHRRTNSIQPWLWLEAPLLCDAAGEGAFLRWKLKRRYMLIRKKQSCHFKIDYLHRRICSRIAKLFLKVYEIATTLRFRVKYEGCTMSFSPWCKTRPSSRLSFQTLP